MKGLGNPVAYEYQPLPLLHHSMMTSLSSWKYSLCNEC